MDCRCSLSRLKRQRVLVLLALTGPCCFSETVDGSQSAKAWRLVNAEAVEIAWRLRSLQFFSDEACTSPIAAAPNQTGEAFGSEASEMTGPEYVFALQSPRGWESLEKCAPGECQIGFAWRDQSVAVRCVLLHQGETEFHAPSIALQYRAEDSKAWSEAVTWKSLNGGRLKLALSCPGAPAVEFATVSNCKGDGPRHQECKVRCEQGYGTLEPKMSCVNGAWYTPQCLPLGSLVRLVPEEPQRLAPYWVVLHAQLFASADCSAPIAMEGTAISSGEYVIKYASYHPKNAWDSDESTSWASKGPCHASGPCWLGFRFHQDPGPVRCVSVQHPEGDQYQARRVSVQKLGAIGWEEVKDVEVHLLPKGSQEL